MNSQTAILTCVHLSGNYSRDDTTQLFDLVEEELPVGPKGWKVVHKGYNQWAKSNGRPLRSSKSLENKYKQVHNKIPALKDIP